MQVYNLQPDEKTKRSSVNIAYEIVNTANNQPVMQSAAADGAMNNVGGQFTLAKTLVLANFRPGVYKLIVKVDDNVSKQQIAPSIRFTVE